MKIATATYDQKTDTHTVHIKTLTISQTVRLVPSKSDKPKAPDYWIEGEHGAEYGAAWKKTSGDGNPYVQLKLDDPFQPRAIFANLVNGEIIWSRPKPKHTGNSH